MFNIDELKENQDLDTIENIKKAGMPVVVLGAR